jgi:hypothetical protein
VQLVNVEVTVFTTSAKRYDLPSESSSRSLGRSVEPRYAIASLQEYMTIELKLRPRCPSFADERVAE